MGWYYDEANETEMWSELCFLADKAVMVAEQENEEEIKKTRETIRSSLVKRSGYSQQNHENHNASSPLLDLNEIPTHSMQENPRHHSQRLSSSSSCKKRTPQNPPCSEPMVSDEEKRSRKGKSKIVSEEEDEDEEEESEERLFQKTMKKFARTSRTYPQQIHENLNGASTSSSHHVLNTAESEKTRAKSPPNPKYQSSPSSRKKRAVMTSGQVKKTKVAPLPETEPREIPEWLVQTMREMNGAEDPRLIFDTALTTSDVNPSQSRLLIPFKKLITNDFLTLEEAGAIWRLAVTQEEEENTGLGTILFNQRSEKWGLRFKVWVMKKKSGKETLNYALNWDWNEFVERNDLKASDKIRLWTFRWGGFLCFALDTDTE